MGIILGIDPGSRLTGYGLIRQEGQRLIYVESGCIRIQGTLLGDRLRQIFSGLQEIIDKHQPEDVAIEQIFMHRNAGSALKLGQARGVAIAAAAMQSLPVAEYSARQIKQAVVGHGAAKKEQVQHMVRILLGLNADPQADAADALGVALCHAHSRKHLKIVDNQQKYSIQMRFRRGRMRGNR